MKDDSISRQEAIRLYCREHCGWEPEKCPLTYEQDGTEECSFVRLLKELPSAEPTQTNTPNTLESLDCISRQEAIDAVLKEKVDEDESLLESPFECNGMIDCAVEVLERLPSVQLERDTPKRVLWTGWKGYRDTRYKCPNCKKPVKNDDVYCHRCGQKLMFPHISFTDYIPGEKQELIVRWDDEE